MTTLNARYCSLCVLAFALGVDVDGATVRDLTARIGAAIIRRGGGLPHGEAVRAAAAEAGLHAHSGYVRWTGWREAELDYRPGEVPPGVDPFAEDAPPDDDRKAAEAAEARAARDRVEERERLARVLGDEDPAETPGVTPGAGRTVAEGLRRLGARALARSSGR